MTTTLAVVDGIVAQTGDWGFVLGNADYLLGGTVVTILLTVVSLLVGFLVGFPAGVVEVYGSRVPRSIVRAVGVVLRGTPLVVILIFAFFVFPITSFVPDVTVLGFEFGSAFAAAVLGLGLRSAAYQSQIFRGTIQSVAEGQMEAARAIGLSKLGAIRHVVVPQALRRSIPGFQNEFTIVLKDTSIAFAIGLAELLTRSRDLFVEQTTAVLEVILFASAIYFVLTIATNQTLDRLGELYAVPGGES